MIKGWKGSRIKVLQYLWTEDAHEAQDAGGNLL